MLVTELPELEPDNKIPLTEKLEKPAGAVAEASKRKLTVQVGEAVVRVQ